MNTIKTHIGYIVAITIAVVVGWFTFQSWKMEHDQRVVNQFKADGAEKQIASLQKDIDQIRADRDVQIATLKAQSAAVRTPSQAIAAIPSVAKLALHSQPVPTEPNAVQVDAIPLYQELNNAAQDRVNLAACEAGSGKKDSQLQEKDNEITALKKKPPLRARAWGEVKRGSFWVGVGIAVAKVVLK